MMKIYFWLLLILLHSCNHKQAVSQKKIQCGSERIDDYLALVKDKPVGVVANQTSLVDGTHLVDSLIGLGVEIKKIFAPEHGFRGMADAGEWIKNGMDSITGLPVVSLYGKHKKPAKEDLEDIAWMIFDIQDVGVRCYTYISTLHYVMEACAENGKPLLILDRPNPNGHYVDGPMLDTAYRSFVGMHPVPLVHGMTIGEYAQMINGEKWLKNGVHCDLIVVSCDHYTHDSLYQLPVKPSPNLPNMTAIYLYPTLVLFEGTVMSVGRGTDFPFQVIGHPGMEQFPFRFMPRSIPGVSTNPKHLGKVCYGEDLREQTAAISKIQVPYLIRFWKAFPEKEKFFQSFFDKLAGSDTLRTHIQNGMSDTAIWNSWEKELQAFKKVREKYLLYPDFHKE